jgi:uncharacterized protein (TIGR03437 family)
MIHLMLWSCRTKAHRKTIVRLALFLLTIVVLLGLEPPAPKAVAAQAEAYFVIKFEPRHDLFVVKLTDPVKIQQARDILSGKASPKGIQGRIVKQAVPWNPPWSFHFDPPSVSFFDFAIEVCDGSVGYVESFLADAGGAFLPGNIWCPWSSRLLREIPAPTSGSGLTNVSGASYERVGLTPDSIASAFGSNLALRTEKAESLPLPLALAGTTVTIKDSLGVARLAPLFYVSPLQVNYLIPPDTAVGFASITVTNANGIAVTEWTQILHVAPGIFTANSDGQDAPAGWAVHVKADGSQRLEPLARFDPPHNRFVPAEIDLGPDGEQVFLTLFGTGLRRSRAELAQAEIGTVAAEIHYLGKVEGYEGLDQINLRLPRELRGHGEVAVDILVDDQRTNLTRVRIK